jgi:hypothetical protein
MLEALPARWPQPFAACYKARGFDLGWQRARRPRVEEGVPMPSLGLDYLKVSSGWP